MQLQTAPWFEVLGRAPNQLSSVWSDVTCMSESRQMRAYLVALVVVKLIAKEDKPAALTDVVVDVVLLLGQVAHLGHAGDLVRFPVRSAARCTQRVATCWAPIRRKCDTLCVLLTSAR